MIKSTLHVLKGFKFDESNAICSNDSMKILTWERREACRYTRNLYIELTKENPRNFRKIFPHDSFRKVSDPLVYMVVQKFTNRIFSKDPSSSPHSSTYDTLKHTNGLYLLQLLSNLSLYQ